MDVGVADRCRDRRLVPPAHRADLRRRAAGRARHPRRQGDDRHLAPDHDRHPCPGRAPRRATDHAAGPPARTCCRTSSPRSAPCQPPASPRRRAPRAREAATGTQSPGHGPEGQTTERPEPANPARHWAAVMPAGLSAPFPAGIPPPAISSGDLDQYGHRHRAALRGVAVKERQVRRVGQAAADQHPVPRRGGRRPRPFVVAVALAAAPARAGLPRAGRDQPG